MAKKILMWISVVFILLAIIVCTFFYFNQEKIIFYPEKLARNHNFHFKGKFEEKYIKTADGLMVHGILFKADSAKGLIFYLHGNAGSLDSWGDVAEVYTHLHYDVFMLDYRGYGKSEGEISSQAQMFSDVQITYDELRKGYSENTIIILGYSIGTGLAAKLASTNHPLLLILQAPYYNLTDLARQHFRYVPAFLLKYKFETNLYLKDCETPIFIFHGDEDDVIAFDSSLRLKTELGNKVTLMRLSGEGHNGMTYNPDYVTEISKILNRIIIHG